MPTIKKGESEKDYVARCIPYCIHNEGLAPDAAAAKCHGMWSEHQKKGTNYTDDSSDAFAPPEAGTLPDAGKKILAKVYSECRSHWVAEHPDDKENEGNKTMCSQVAWIAVHNAGYKKNEQGDWGHTDKTESLDFNFTFQLQLSEPEQQLISTPKNTMTEDNKWVKVGATAIVGDRMMNGYFMPYNELKKSLDAWNGTLHDVSHLGTSYPDSQFPYKRENIEYVVGYQKNAQANDSTKEITMDVYINKKAPKYEVWKSFIDISKESGRTPNVSVSISAKPKEIRATELNYHDKLEYGAKA